MKTVATIEGQVIEAGDDDGKAYVLFSAEDGMQFRVEAGRDVTRTLAQHLYGERVRVRFEVES